MSAWQETVLKLQKEIQDKYNESIPEVAADGNIKRFPKSATWCVGYEWEFKGKNYCLFQYGNWKFADGTNRVDSFERSEFKNKTFLKDFTEKMAQINQRVADEKKEKNEACREKWLPKFNIADKEALHDYLIDKGLESNFGSRVDSQGVLLIPAYDSSPQFTGVQRIFKNPDTNEFEKRFSAGIKIQGSIFPLKKFKDASIVYVSEGFATAATIQMAFPDIPSICVFNANNIYHACVTIRSINPSCKIIIAADRDKESNTGEKYSRMTCKKISSCIYKMPVFKNDNGKWTDFNDLYQFNSINDVREQLKYKVSDFVIIQPLGVLKDRYFYMSSENPQEISILGHNHTEKHLYNLVPDRSWWMRNYPSFEKDDELKEDPKGIDWTLAANTLMRNCINKGMYNPSNVRSSGIWEDNGVYYYHNGHKLYDGRNDVDVFNERLTKHYTMGKACHEISKKEQLSKFERETLVEIFGTISTKTQQQGLLLLGWVVSAPIAGALPWRPHVWITGESSQGKSWTMENIIGVILNGFCIRPQGDSTEAGIRQFVGNQALPLVCDEFETDDVRSSERREAVVALARQSSTPTDGVIMRGTAGGSAMSFSPNFSMCVSAINHALIHKQDKNRWTLIEFSGNRAGKDQFAKVKEMVDSVIDPHVGKKLVSYVFHNIDTYLENFYNIEQYLKEEKGHKGHFARQYSCLLAGLCLIIHNEPIEKDSLDVYLDRFNFDEYFEKAGDDDPEVFREFLLNTLIRFDGDNLTIAELINKSSIDRANVFQKILMRYGIKAGVGCFYVKRTSNKNFQDLFKNSKWRNNWNVLLERINGSDNNDNRAVWINGSASKVIKIPFEKWSQEE